MRPYNPMQPLLELQDISYSHKDSGLMLLDHVNLRVNRGDYIIIRGASGTGKSTLLRLICRLHELTGGTILFHGAALSALPPAKLRASISYVPQIPTMVEGSVADNLLLPFSFQANTSSQRPSPGAILEMLEQFYLKEVSPDQSAMKLSVGQKQRVALMRALLTDPEVLLLDEPTSALDGESAEMVFRIIERLNIERGKAVLMVTHSSYTPEHATPINFTLQNRSLIPA